MSSYYPLFLNVRGKRCVVVGGGLVALRKVKALLEHEASVGVISPDLCPGLSQLAERGAIQVFQSPFLAWFGFFVPGQDSYLLWKQRW